MQKYLLVGLGNPGDIYHYTRHNIGFEMIDYLADKFSCVWQIKKYGWWGYFKYKGHEIYLLKPNTFMNLSGKAVLYAIEKTKVSLDNVLIITDDLALPYGKLRLRLQGSHGGHNGLKHIEEMLQTREYTRLRIGIGNTFAIGQQTAYVLGKWELEQQNSLQNLGDLCQEAILSFVCMDRKLCMSQINSKTLII